MACVCGLLDASRLLHRSPCPQEGGFPIHNQETKLPWILDSILIMEDTERGFLHSEDGAVARRTFYLPSPHLSKYWVGGKIGNMHGGD